MLLNCPSMNQWHVGVPRSARGPTFAGMLVLIFGVFGFGIWAVWAPLDGAVVAPGSFVAFGQNKLLQHLEGGIVKDILVSEGEMIEARQVVMRLDETAVKAKLRRLTVRYLRLSILQSRLQSEVQQKDEIEYPERLLKAGADPEIAEIIARQKAEIIARQMKKQAEIEVLKKEIAGLEDSIEGYQAQIDSTRHQMKLFKEELNDKQALLKKSLIRKTEILSLQRAESRLAGELGQLLGRVGDTNERVARANQQIAHIHSTAIQKAVEELRATETEIDDIKEQIRAAQDVVERIEIQSPVRGIVVKLNYHTSGGVIAPGSTIMELLPINEELVIESRISAGDIAHVKEGQAALIRLSALNQRMTPMIAGHVAYVSADAVTEQDPRKAAMMAMMPHGSFVVRVRLDETDVRSKLKNFIPTPGMPADMYIKTGERTFFQYLLKPVVDSFSRAFREQ